MLVAPDGESTSRPWKDAMWNQMTATETPKLTSNSITVSSEFVRSPSGLTKSNPNVARYSGQQRQFEQQLEHDRWAWPRYVLCAVLWWNLQCCNGSDRCHSIYAAKYGVWGESLLNWNLIIQFVLGGSSDAALRDSQAEQWVGPQEDLDNQQWWSLRHMITHHEHRAKWLMYSVFPHPIT